MAPERSPLRPRMEEKFRRAGLYGLTASQISRDLNAGKKGVVSCLSALAESRLIYLKGENLNRENRWVWHEFQPVSKPRPAPIRASNQPTGDQAYWEEQTRKLMTPPRRVP